MSDGPDSAHYRCERASRAARRRAAGAVRERRQRLLLQLLALRGRQERLARALLHQARREPCGAGSALGGVRSCAASSRSRRVVTVCGWMNLSRARAACPASTTSASIATCPAFKATPASAKTCSRSAARTSPKPSAVAASARALLRAGHRRSRKRRRQRARSLSARHARGRAAARRRGLDGSRSAVRACRLHRRVRFPPLPRPAPTSPVPPAGERCSWQLAVGSLRARADR